MCSLQTLGIARSLEAPSRGTLIHANRTQSVGDDRCNDPAVVVGLSNTLGSSRVEPDNISVISNAFSVIELASKLKRSSLTAGADRNIRRSQPQLEPVPLHSPEVGAFESTNKQKLINRFIDEIVDLSQEQQLYSRDPSSLQIEQLVKIVSTALKLCDALQPQRRGSPTSPRFGLPEVESSMESFRESIFSTLSRHSNNTSSTEWSGNRPALPESAEASPKSAETPKSMPNAGIAPAGDVEALRMKAPTERNSASAFNLGRSSWIPVRRLGRLLR